MAMVTWKPIRPQLLQSFVKRREVCIVKGSGVPRLLGLMIRGGVEALLEDYNFYQENAPPHRVIRGYPAKGRWPNENEEEDLLEADSSNKKAGEWFPAHIEVQLGRQLGPFLRSPFQQL